MSQPRPVLAHIAVRTTDVDKSISFYRKIGGELLRTDSMETPAGRKKYAMISFAGVQLELLQVFEPAGEGNIAHIAFYVDNLDRSVAELQEKGIVFDTEENKTVPLFGGLTDRFFRGPSGEAIELIQK